MDIELVCREHLCGDSSGYHCLELPAPGDSLTIAVDEFPQRDTHWRFVETRSVHVSADREKSGSALLGRAQAGEALGTFAQDERNARQGLDVVHDSRALEKARDCGERRFELGKAFPALQRREQGCLFAADISSGATMNDHIQIESAPLDVLAQPAAGV